MRAHKLLAVHGINAALVAASLGACAAGLSVQGCSSSSPAAPAGGSSSSGAGSSGSGASCATNDLKITFNPMYSAFESTHMYALPAVVKASGVSWSASDSTAVGIQPNADLTKGGYTGATITVLKATGPVTITAQTGSQCGTATLNITEATAQDWAIGNARYNNGQSLHSAAFFQGRDAGSAVDGGSLYETPGTPPPACTNCHGPTATDKMFTDVAHTPEQTAGFSDNDLLSIILNGTVPAGGYFNPNIVTMATWHTFHQWQDITPDQQKGIIVYLRSLTPMSETGGVNLGGLGMQGADGGGNGSSDAGASGE